ncbi:MAG: hypothetical protein AAFR90_00300 [Pseudomonadota bacterium]
MKAQDFKDFIAQLDVLSEVQREALMAALKGKGAANEAIALIETQFAAAPCCGHCKSERIKLWGHASGLRRYKCRDCERTFNALTGTPLAQLHRRDAWLDYARALVDCLSIRKAATRWIPRSAGAIASFRPLATNVPRRSPASSRPMKRSF